MDIQLCFFNSVIISSFLLIITAAFAGYKKRNHKLKPEYLLIPSVLIIMVLIFPQYFCNEKNSTISSIVFSFLYALKTTSCGQDWKLCREVIPTNSVIKFVYYLLIYTDYLAVPVFTVGFLVSFFQNFTDLFKYKLSRKKKIIVFSELNENSLSLAESIKNTVKTRIVFCNCNNTEIKDSKNIYDEVKKLGALVFDKDEFSLKLKKGVNSITFYEISSDKDKNLENAIKLIEKYRDNIKTDIRIKVFSVGRLPELMLDSIWKGNISVELVDEIKYSCYQLLFDKPLFENLNETEDISVMIIGGGYTGTEFIKAVSWCGQMKKHNLKINVFDKDPDIEARFKCQCPELTQENGYNISFYNCDIESSKFKEKVIKYCSDTSYVVICTNDDNLNIETAILIRELFWRMQVKSCESEIKNDYPLINARARRICKNRLVNGLTFKNAYYSINCFGMVSQIFNASTLNNSLIDNIARNIHLSYKLKNDESIFDINEADETNAIKDYYNGIYNQRSSLAAAIHFKYKIYDLIGYKGNIDKKSIDILRKELSNNSKLEELSKTEHLRWNSYMRSEGFLLAEIKDVKKYYSFTNSDHRFSIAKLHPVIVDWEDIDSVSESLRELNKNYDFKNDIRICMNLPDILEKSIKNI